MKKAKATDSVYTFIDWGSVNMSESENICNSMSATLAIIDNEMEHDAVQEIFLAMQTHFMWIGGSSTTKIHQNEDVVAKMSKYRKDDTG